MEPSKRLLRPLIYTKGFVKTLTLCHHALIKWKDSTRFLKGVGFKGVFGIALNSKSAFMRKCVLTYAGDKMSF